MRTLFKNGFIALLGLLSLGYLLNPTAGVFELLPDNLPIIGNLDEAAATAILLGSLAHFGFDLRFFRQRFGFGPKGAVDSPTSTDQKPWSDRGE